MMMKGCSLLIHVMNETPPLGISVKYLLGSKDRIRFVYYILLAVTNFCLL